MDKQKRSAGITLIALVISIIVMLILAGVSLNATVGDNGILKQAQKATELSKISSALENINTELVGYSVNGLTEGIDEILYLTEVINGLYSKGVIDEALNGTLVNGLYENFDMYEDDEGHKFTKVKKEGYEFNIYVNDSGEYYAEESKKVAGGHITGGTYTVTSEVFNANEGITDPNEKGKFTISGSTKIFFEDSLGTKEDHKTASDNENDFLSIYVQSGADVQIYFRKSKNTVAADGKTYYCLTNSNLRRSAIDIEPGGMLTLNIDEDVIISVNSGFGIDAKDMEGGKGAFAGIHVWDNGIEESVLNVKGKGTLIAIGGDGSNAATNNLDGHGGAGGGGAGAGIGANGSNGGDGSTGYGKNGNSSAEKCGIVNIYNTVNIYAYGGAGGNGAMGPNSTGGGRRRISSSWNWWSEELVVLVEHAVQVVVDLQEELVKMEDINFMVRTEITEVELLIITMEEDIFQVLILKI